MPTSDFTPTVKDVAALLPTRTRDRGGTEVGDFTEDTKPTGDQVTSLIAEAVDEVAGSVGVDLPDGPDPDDPDSIRRMAQSAVTLLAAMNVELTKYPEQVNSNRSAYPQFLARYERLMGNGGKITGILIDAVQDIGGGEGPSVAAPSQHASHTFPPGYTVPGTQWVWDTQSMNWRMVGTLDVPVEPEF